MQYTGYKLLFLFEITLILFELKFWRLKKKFWHIDSVHVKSSLIFFLFLEVLLILPTFNQFS